MYADTITAYLVEEYCPTTETDDCAHNVAEHYVEMIVRRVTVSTTILTIHIYRMLSSTIL